MSNEGINSDKAILGLIAGLLVINYLLVKSDTLLTIIVALATLSVISSTFAHYLAKFWLGLGKILGRINGTILLGVVYFLLITPLAFLKRTLGKSTFFKNGDSPDSGFTKHDAVVKPEDIELPW